MSEKIWRLSGTTYLELFGITFKDAYIDVNKIIGKDEYEPDWENISDFDLFDTYCEWLNNVGLEETLNIMATGYEGE